MISLKSKNWTIENIETILFDKDGTFIDLNYFWGKMTELRAQEVIKRYNLDQNNFSKICLFLGYDIKSQKMLPEGITALYSRSKIIEIFKNDLSEIGLNITIQELEKLFDEVSEIFYKNMEKYTKPIDSAIEFIKKIKNKNIKTAIVTSDSINSTNLTIKHFNWEKLFDIALGRESTNNTKESGEIALLALEKLKADPKTTIMIGDAPMDYLCAKNANIEKTILVASGQIALKELAKTSKYTIENLSELEIL